MASRVSETGYRSALAYAVYRAIALLAICIINRDLSSLGKCYRWAKARRLTPLRGS